ncbi:hypothetical protein, partial [Elstera cyanobacteriorum]|uniref:hypothetical protein n=1 Tax=Elstera cyanobacteriorum TaxID=2022747 RepID=UPI0023F37B36
AGPRKADAKFARWQKRKNPTLNLPPRLLPVMAAQQDRQAPSHFRQNADWAWMYIQPTPET